MTGRIAYATRRVRFLTRREGAVAVAPTQQEFVSCAKQALADALRRWSLDHDGSFNFADGEAKIEWSDDEVRAVVACP